ncbi:MAG: ABC transporter permease [Candidatus Lambdaproteobacteria bacterium]|nr:ABC transporter permease [Candidatus Lambdaproteobacteria bacterium]
MLPYLIRRLLLAVPVLVGVSLVSFVLVYLSGDPASIILPPDASEAARREFRAEHGLDKPLWVQYGDYLVRLVRGNFGVSFRYGSSAGDLVWERVPATLELALVSMLLAVAVGIPSGVYSAYRRNSALDTLVRSLTLLGQAVPHFYLGIVLIIVFAVGLRWFPTGGRGSVAQVVMPALTLATFLMALVARVTRSCMLDVLGRDYVRTARAKGLPERSVLLRHSLKNAMIPVVTVIGLQFGLLLNGVVVTETVFAWPGIGRLAVQSIYARDLPVVQAIVFLSAFFFVFVNLLVDLLYAWLDPRISYS